MTLRLEKFVLIQASKRSARARPRAIARARAETLEKRRERVVRLAAPLFLKRGYDNVSIDEIIGGRRIASQSKYFCAAALLLAESFLAPLPRPPATRISGS
jgi:hypothetical protein